MNKLTCIIVSSVVCIASCHDALYWNLAKPSQFTLDVFKDAQVAKPVVVFALDSFDLLDFNVFANVYRLAGNSQAGEKKIIKYMRSSVGYGSEGVNGDFMKYMPKDGVVAYNDDADIDNIANARVVIVPSKDLAYVEKRVDHVLEGLKGKAYIAVIIGHTSTHSHKISKREVGATASNDSVIDIKEGDCGLRSKSVTLVIGPREGLPLNMPLKIASTSCVNVTSKTPTMVIKKLTIQAAPTTVDKWTTSGGTIEMTFNLSLLNYEWFMYELKVYDLGLKADGNAVSVMPMDLKYMNPKYECVLIVMYISCMKEYFLLRIPT